MITAADMTNETARRLARKRHGKASAEAVAAFESCGLPLTATEREGCLRAILDDPKGALRCYLAIRNSRRPV